VPHDAADPVGFVVSTANSSLGILTDLGYATRQIIHAVRGVHALVIETNHDETLLQNDTKRPWSVKQRILSRHGHLSNQAAAKLVAEIATENLRHILLAHLSEDCNTPEIARDTIRQNLPPTLPAPEIHCPGTPPHPIPHTIRIGHSVV
jgi:phosphoribosyl 1,2-cyclic phosphodiesterase